MLSMGNFDDFVYGKNDQLKLHRQYLKYVSPKRYKEKQNIAKEYEKGRNQTPERKAMKNACDKVRDQTLKRKIFHKELDETPKRRAMLKEKDKIRDQLPQRKEMHKGKDRIRDQLPERKKMHKEKDKIRDQLPQRKEMHNQLPERITMHQEIDRIRDQLPERIAKRKAMEKIRTKRDDRKLKSQAYEATDTRRKYMNTYNKNRKNNSLLTTDTGFDVICFSCLQYKSRYLCKSSQSLSEEKRNKFLIKCCSILKNREEEQFVCHLCLKDINRNKIPQRSRINKFKFGNFPISFIRILKQRCKFKKRSSKYDVSMNDEIYEREALKLNKLEAYILKLCIPFVRIAHCPRGPYLKVKGDLILISADINHSLSKVLPLQQSLIPVCFKRKLSYQGSYIEEYIETEKIKLYFYWLKKNNHLYKDVELDSNLIDIFESETKSLAAEFCDGTRADDDIYQSDEEVEESREN